MNTGEFAKYCGTEKRTIFYYDQIGLLKPAAVHENGYRKYTLQQAETMDMIKILQASGYSLKEIKEIITGNADARRCKLTDAKGILDNRIAELSAMKSFIERKECLWQEYQLSQSADLPYTISHKRLSYIQKDIQMEQHFFSFLLDGEYDTIMLDADHHVAVIKMDDTGYCREGRAISFFIEVSSESPDIVAIIQQKLYAYQFFGERKYYMNTLPHLLIENEGLAVIKITVFEYKCHL